MAASLLAERVISDESEQQRCHKEIQQACKDHHQPGDRTLLTSDLTGATDACAIKEGGRSGQADFLAAPVAAGQGVVLMPRVVARGLVRPGVVRLSLTAPVDLRWDIAFIWRQGAYLSKAAQAWLALLREQVYHAPSN